MNFNYKDVEVIMDVPTHVAKKYVWVAMYGFDKLDNFKPSKIKLTDSAPLENFCYFHISDSNFKNLIKDRIDFMRQYNSHLYILPTIVADNDCRFTCKLQGKYKTFYKILTTAQIKEIETLLEKKLTKFIQSGGKVPDKYAKYKPKGVTCELPELNFE